MNIAVFGMGYVGMVNMACLAKLGHVIWGCDIKGHKVSSVLDGKSPIYEPGVDDMIRDGLAQGRVHASTSAHTVLENTEMALICVGTPSRADGTVNLDFILNTTREIAAGLKKLNKRYTIVYRSTIPPGSVEDVFLPVLEQEMGPAIAQTDVAFLPEFLREGSAVDDFFNCSRIVIGCNKTEPEALREVFSYSSEIPVVFTDLRTAEFIKYVDNAFHAMKITFANEAYRTGAAYGINVEVANRIFLMDRHLNISETYLRPGLPFGGSCLPKDMRAINHLAEKKKLQLPVLGHILESNSLQQKELFRRVAAHRDKQITVYGLTFKSGTDDVRESPMLILARDLADAGISFKIFDPDIHITQLRIDHPWIVKFISEQAPVAFENADVIVVCKKNFISYNQLIPSKAHIMNFISLKKFDLSNSQELLY